jgi:choline dehydrogenase-like flavoprotein
VDCDICIIGTGAAGGILAYRLAMAGLDVLSLEQGQMITNEYFTNGQRPEQDAFQGIAPTTPWPLRPTDSFYFDNAAAHQLYAAASDRSTTSASENRFLNRQVFRLNGKQNLWGGVCLRYSTRDFRGKESGDSALNWPIGYDDLVPHYAAVESLIGVCGTREQLDVMPDSDFIPPKPLRPVDDLFVRAVRQMNNPSIRAIPSRKAIETRQDAVNACQSCGKCIHGCRAGSIYKFSSHLLPQIARRRNYRLVPNCKVIRLERAANSRVIQHAVCLDTEGGGKFRVQARNFVVASGALETPRLLFNSADAGSPRGLANQSGLLGCYLQDNVRASVGASLLKLLAAEKSDDVGFGDQLLVPRFLFDNREFRGGYQGQFAHVLPLQPFYAEALQPFPGWLRERLARTLFRTYGVVIFQGKPEAIRENCITPSGEVDRFGVPQVDTHYRPTENDRRMQASMVHYGRRMMQKCWGIGIEEIVDPLPGNGVHYAGTTRMAARPDDGVVDTDLCTFEHPNLYLCDGGVLPEISEKNLTLTIMALADRLATLLIAKRASVQ